MEICNKKPIAVVSVVRTLVLTLLLVSCENPLGESDQRDSSFAPGSGGSSDGSVADTTPPDSPSGLNLLDRWVSGANPASSPVFTWTNPSEDFAQAEVALGLSPGGEEVQPFITSSGVSSHTFNSINLTECSLTYYPSVQAVDTAGNRSTPVSEILGFRYDNTLPVAVGGLTIPAWNGSNDRTVTVDWSALPGSDNCGIDHYEIALGYDSASDGFDATDTGNLISWREIPGGNAVTSYQIQDGVDGFSFTSDFDRQYFLSIRVVDEAGLTSSVTHSSGWYTFHPSQFTSLVMWFDGSDTSTTFQDIGCSTTPAVNPGDPVACWSDKSTLGNHATQNTGAKQPQIGTTGLFFDGVNYVMGVAAKTYSFTDNLTMIVLYEADTQSNDGGSCCRPILSLASNSGGLYPWIGMTRGNLAPPNNLFHGWSGSGLSVIPTAPGDTFITAVTHNGTGALWNAWTGGTQQVFNQAMVNYTSTTFSIGGDPSNTARRVRGEIYETIVIEDILSNTERQNLEGYLACKYSMRDRLDPAHPYYDLVGANLSGCP